MLLDALPIETPEDVEWLRYLRNATRMGFSHDNTEISQLAQRAWWIAMRGRVKGWLYILPPSPEAMVPGIIYQAAYIGFGILRQDQDGKWWNSLGVLSAYHGHGFGSFITADLIDRQDGPIYASVRQDNPAAIAMHHSVDWELIDGPEPDRLLYFKSRR